MRCSMCCSTCHERENHCRVISGYMGACGTHRFRASPWEDPTELGSLLRLDYSKTSGARWPRECSMVRISRILRYVHVLQETEASGKVLECGSRTFIPLLWSSSEEAYVLATRLGPCGQSRRDHRLHSTNKVITYYQDTALDES